MFSVGLCLQPPHCVSVCYRRTVHEEMDSSSEDWYIPLRCHSYLPKSRSRKQRPVVGISLACVFKYARLSGAVEQRVLLFASPARTLSSQAHG